MASPTQTIDSNTYSATTASTNITLSDDAYGLIQAINKLTEAVNRFASRGN